MTGSPNSCPGRDAARSSCEALLRQKPGSSFPLSKRGPGSAGASLAITTCCAGVRGRDWPAAGWAKALLRRTHHPCSGCWSQMVGTPSAARSRARPGLPHPTRSSQNGISSSMSLLRAPAPAATAPARRGAAWDRPIQSRRRRNHPTRKLPPPPLRPSQHGQVGIEPLQHPLRSSIFSTPLWSVHFRVCSAPRYKLGALLQILLGDLGQGPSLKITTRCHSVFSWRSPVALSRQFSDRRDA